MRSTPGLAPVSIDWGERAVVYFIGIKIRKVRGTLEVCDANARVQMIRRTNVYSKHHTHMYIVKIGCLIIPASPLSCDQLK